jgi:hypothetical protein
MSLAMLLNNAAHSTIVAGAFRRLDDDIHTAGSRSWTGRAWKPLRANATKFDRGNLLSIAVIFTVGSGAPKHPVRSVTRVGIEGSCVVVSPFSQSGLSMPRDCQDLQVSHRVRR